MSASRQPVESDFSNGNNWIALVRDQGYRLFAAGNGRAVIIERLPVEPGQAEPQSGPQPCSGFDSRYGLKPDARKLQSRFILLTEVSRSAMVSRIRVAGKDVTRDPRSTPWKAVRSIQSVTRLESYMANEAGKLLFFLVRSPRSGRSSAGAASDRPDASAVQIGKSLGMSEADLDALRVAGLARQSDGDVSSITTGEGNEPARCKCPGCVDSPVATLEGQLYCKEHFLSVCYQRLDDCADHLSQRPVSHDLSDQLRSFLSACIDQANALTRAPFSQDSLERARLLDIRYTALALRARLRRSTRVSESRPVRLVCETPGRPWQEESSTFLISRFGAMLQCKNLVRPEDWLFVERLDTGTRVRARMAWRETGKAGSFCVGLEFLDSDNFWGLPWADPAPARRDPASACSDRPRARSISA